VLNLNRRGRLFIVAAGLIAAAVGWSLVRRSASAQPLWQGYVDADYVRVAPVEGGVLTKVAVARGTRVAVDDPLFDQDDTAERAARDQAARQAAQAEQQLANLEASGKATEILQAEANLAEAEATEQRAKLDLKRGEALLVRQDISQQAVDQLRATENTAAANVNATKAALDQIRGPVGRNLEIAAQAESAGAARAMLAAADWRLAQRHVVAPVAAEVADVLARTGEDVSAGMPVVSLLPPGNILIRFFVPEPMLATVHNGDAVALICDRCPPQAAAIISFISPQAEYTPPLIYSEESKSKLVYLIEARPRTDQATLFNPGEPVEVRQVKRQ
jgi:HlyD family secretion protein